MKHESACYNRTAEKCTSAPQRGEPIKIRWRKNDAVGCSHEKLLFSWDGFYPRRGFLLRFVLFKDIPRFERLWDRIHFLARGLGSCLGFGFLPCPFRFGFAI